MKRLYPSSGSLGSGPCLASSPRTPLNWLQKHRIVAMAAPAIAVKLRLTLSRYAEGGPKAAGPAGRLNHGGKPYRDLCHAAWSANFWIDLARAFFE